MDFSSVYGEGGDEGLDGQEGEMQLMASTVADGVFDVGNDDDGGGRASKQDVRRAESLTEALRISGFANDAVVALALRPGEAHSMSGEGQCAGCVVGWSIMGIALCERSSQHPTHSCSHSIRQAST